MELHLHRLDLVVEVEDRAEAKLRPQLSLTWLAACFSERAHHLIRTQELGPLPRPEAVELADLEWN